MKALILLFKSTVSLAIQQKGIHRTAVEKKDLLAIQQKGSQLWITGRLLRRKVFRFNAFLIDRLKTHQEEKIKGQDEVAKNPDCSPTMSKKQKYEKFDFSSNEFVALSPSMSCKE
ncbi:hypothetical protein SUGI_0935240 [Cryptomeria japonica]|nr:hypothetical protein SUGI_0935240 [Cryptomeria japonica]